MTTSSVPITEKAVSLTVPKTVKNRIMSNTIDRRWRQHVELTGTPGQPKVTCPDLR